MTDKKDYIGIWYEARKELGVPDDIAVGWFNKKTHQIELKGYCHSETDGIGMIADFLRPQGFACQPLPVSRDTHEPSWSELKKLAKHHPETKIKKRINWKATREFTFGEQTKPEIRHICKADTDKLMIKANENNVSLVNYLFWSINKIVADNLLSDELNYYWMYPVNMRGFAKIPHEKANGSSGIEICANKYSTAAELEKQVHNCLKSKQQWSLWKQAQLSRYLGKSGIKFILKYLTGNNFYAGSFSYLGKWPLEDSNNPSVNPEKILFLVGPSSPNYPVCTVITNWNNELSISLKLHACLMINEKTCRELADKWLSLLLNNN